MVSKSNRAILVCSELEEEGANPKLVIGDIANLFIAKQVRIGGLDYSLKNAKLLLGVRVVEKPTKDGGRDRNENARKKVANLGRLIPAMTKDAPLKGIKVTAVTESEYEVLVRSMERQMCDWVGVPVIPHPE